MQSKKIMLQGIDTMKLLRNVVSNDNWFSVFGDYYISSKRCLDDDNDYN